MDLILDAKFIQRLRYTDIYLHAHSAHKAVDQLRTSSDQLEIKTGQDFAYLELKDFANCVKEKSNTRNMLQVPILQTH